MKKAIKYVYDANPFFISLQKAFLPKMRQEIGTAVCWQNRELKLS